MTTDSDLHKINSQWTDHSLLSITCTIGYSSSGPGLWRANPLLLNVPGYHQCVQDNIALALNSTPLGESDQDKWDRVKTRIKTVTKRFAYVTSKKKSDKLKELQRSRNRFLRSQPDLDSRLDQLPLFDQEIALLQKEKADILAMKAGIRWQEQGETSVKFLKNMYTVRQAQQNITSLRSSPSTDAKTELDDILPIAQRFYQTLYTKDEVPINTIET